ncbi:MAG TPA: SMI1/KNR4 family protein [Planctomycetota bacterium]|nr:SMI1/KNR4 family protein [Planctomycetota bacterium]
MSIYDLLRAALPSIKLYRPATNSQIARVEQSLNFKFPDWLRELYLQTNGVVSSDSSSTYLFALERTDDFSESLLSWNQFQRAEWLSNWTSNVSPKVEWNDFDVHQFLLIGTFDGISNWAIKHETGSQIILYDVRDEKHDEIFADNFADACIKQEKWIREIEDDLYCGREFYMPKSNGSDVDRLFQLMLEIDKPRNVLHFHHAISQRPNEPGILFIIRLGAEDQVRLISANGKLPFILRLSVWPLEEDMSCIVWTIKDAIQRIFASRDCVEISWRDGKRPVPDLNKLRSIWTDAGMPNSELTLLANALCARDDHRKREENPRGNRE